MKINKPTVATGVVYERAVDCDVWEILEGVAHNLSDYRDAPDEDSELWGRQYKITVTVEEI